MAREIINVGTVANDGTGDPLRNAMVKVNNMSLELYTAFGDGSLLNAYVAAVGSPSDTQIAVWNNNTELSGATDLTFNGAVGKLTVTGTVPALEITDAALFGSHEIHTATSGLVISADRASLDPASFISLEVDGGAAVHITDQQYVGIGTTTPTVSLDVNGVARTRPVLVSALPLASTAGAGSRAFVTDADSLVFNALAVGGSTNAVPVFSDGTDWRIG